ncbi:helix-turn-helix transcriptional regulator [Candidatus Palauibacter soopunensis]|uniref:PadR family transcriptional regulator n=1 Tax=Candidatus Palauibacter soopunensis TaxID=3056739 RepID=UPI0023912FE0|nr:helix-turn-helix transcriptional regulator [Candidatus Palauibacter soopunensis]MDE2879118.1 helix-turn-helix transcriptional regulator [Candidatus Palauibacter soopunensis]
MRELRKGLGRPVYRELIAASSRPMVLSILAGGESYGYQMLKQVKVLSGGSVDWSDGMLYPVLHRLERDGLIAGRWQLTDAGRRRKYYRLTGRGRRQLSRDRASWRTLTTALEAAWGGAHV